MALVVCPEPPAAEAARLILASGGNAADAAIAAAFTQGVCNPFMCGLSGTALLLHLAADGDMRVLNGEAACGSGSIPARWIETLGTRSEAIGRYPVEADGNQIGPPSTMVPGFVSVCGSLFEAHCSGRFTWAELLGPAISVAWKGFTVYPYIANLWTAGVHEPVTGAAGYPGIAEKFAPDEYARSVYFKPDGRGYQSGETFTQSDLATALDQLATAGAGDFYTGALAARIAADLESRDSLVRCDDLRAFQTIIQRPIEAVFNGYTIFTTPPPSPGVQILEMLRLVEILRPDLGRMESVETIDLLARVMRAGFCDNRDIKAVSLEKSAEWVETIMSPRNVTAWTERIAVGESPGGGYPAASTGTTHLVVIDDEGSVVSFTHSVGSTAGSGSATQGLGFLHNNFLGHFDPRPGFPMSIVPGRRIGSGAPTIVRKDGKLRLALGAPGGSRIITSIFQVLLDVLGADSPLQAAVERWRFHSEENTNLHFEPGAPDVLMERLSEMGHDIRINPYQARVQAIAVDPDGKLHPGIDPRGGTAAFASFGYGEPS